MARSPKTVLPRQAAPVNRWKVLEAEMVRVPAGTNIDGQPTFIKVVVGPEPDARAYFFAGVNPSVAICPLLSSYAVAPCFWSGGLFAGTRSG